MDDQKELNKQLQEVMAPLIEAGKQLCRGLFQAAIAAERLNKLKDDQDG